MLLASFSALLLSLHHKLKFHLITRRLPNTISLCLLFLMFFFDHHRNCGHHLVFKHKSLDSIKQKEENEENCQVLDPSHLDKLPESWSVSYNRVKVLFAFDYSSFNESVAGIIATTRTRDDKLYYTTNKKNQITMCKNHKTLATIFITKTMCLQTQLCVIGCRYRLLKEVNISSQNLSLRKNIS